MIITPLRQRTEESFNNKGMTIMNNKKEYIPIRNKYLANGIQWITGLRYFIHDNEDGSKIYTFPNVPEFHSALSDLKQSKNRNCK